MRAQLRSELIKLRSTRTALGLFAAMTGLVALAIVLHSLLPAQALARRNNQLTILGRGEFIGALFAALLGALTVTSEIRHGTIRPTFLFTPRRGRVLWAKIWASVLAGTAFGLVAGSVAVATGVAAFGARGIDLRLDGSDYALLVIGSAAAGALWAPIGVGVGALIRHQVPTVVGICAWLLFVEGLLAGDLVGLGDIFKYLPGSAASAVSGQEPGTLLAPATGLVLLVAYAAVAGVAGALATSRRDVA
jgi:ABC-type transport system involved in multi-copper enzyme maturation permease subunit